MRLAYLPISMAWAFLFGDTIVRLHVADKSLYMDRSEAIADARLCGLSVAKNGEVIVREVRS